MANKTNRNFDAARQSLVSKAKAASGNTYSPYSKFPVGAAVLGGDGKIYTGCNVENASFGLTICAERNAIFNMVANGQKQISAVAIYTPTGEPTAPCGACRQVINEFGPDALVVSACDGDRVIEMRLSELLPNAFGPENL
jgi:cytidine deaminase